MRRVYFGRINRRDPDQPTFERRPFVEDMRALADSHETRVRLGDTQWVAADLEVSGDEMFMSGVLGFSERGTSTRFDDALFSWVKGETTHVEGASPHTMVPFAVDLREERRWVAFTTTTRIKTVAFANGLEATLNAAVQQLHLWPTDWEVDLVTSPKAVEQWLEDHPNVNEFRRVVKMPNPGRDISTDRQEMRALRAGRKVETFSAQRGSRLNLRDNEDFHRLLEGLDRGDLEIELKERRPGGAVSRFRSNERADQDFVDDFGDDLVRGAELLLGALRHYSAERAGEPPPDEPLTLDDAIGGEPG